LLGYFKVIPKEVEGLKLLEDEIKHFERIKVFLKDIGELEEKIRKVRNYKDPKEEQDSLIRDLQAGRITTDEFKKRYDDLSKRRKEEVFEQSSYTLLIRHVAHHYYVPILLSESERIDWIRHVIRHPSEVRFLNALERYVEQQENGFASLDWWAFSRIDEELDEVYIPYYDPRSNSIRRFLPDFVFWLVKDTDTPLFSWIRRGWGISTGSIKWVVFVDCSGTVTISHGFSLTGASGYRCICYCTPRMPIKLPHTGITGLILLPQFHRL